MLRQFQTEIERLRAQLALLHTVSQSAEPAQVSLAMQAILIFNPAAMFLSNPVQTPSCWPSKALLG